MTKAERFEDLIACQEARALRKEVYAVSKNGASFNDLEMRTRVRDAALSAMNNIAEGCERGSNQEFAQFRNIAKGSAGEVRSTLDAALDEAYVTAAAFPRLCDRALSVSRLCSGLITYLQNATRSQT